MARPPKTRLTDFSLDCDFFSNKKVQALRQSCGATGMLAYMYILCKTYDSGYYFEIKNIDAFCRQIAENISNKHFETVAMKVREAIDFMADKAGLLDRKCLDKGILTSKSIQEHYVNANQILRRKSQLVEYNLLPPIVHLQKNKVYSEETVVNSEKTPVIAAETPVIAAETPVIAAETPVIAAETPFVVQKEKEPKRKSNNISSDIYNISFNTNYAKGVNAHVRVREGVGEGAVEIPRLEEVQTYCQERKSPIDPQRFYDYYTAIGWKFNDAPIRDWKALVRCWERNGLDDPSRTKTITHTKYSDDYLNSLFTNVTEDDD